MASLVGVDWTFARSNLHSHRVSRAYGIRAPRTRAKLAGMGDGTADAQACQCHSQPLSPLAGTWLRKRTRRTPTARPSTASRQSQSAACPATDAAPDRLPPQQPPQLEETPDLLDLSPMLAEQAADQRPALQQPPRNAALPALQAPQSSWAKASGMADARLPSLPHPAEQHKAGELFQPQLSKQQQQQQLVVQRGQPGPAPAARLSAPQQQPDTAADLSSALADSLLQSCSPDEEEQRILAYGTPAFLQQVAPKALIDRQVWLIWELSTA